MAEKVLTVRMTEREHRALKLHAVLQGRSINAVVLGLIRAELRKSAPRAEGPSREEFAAELLDRFGIDPASPEHLAAVRRADEAVRKPAADDAMAEKRNPRRPA